MNPYRAARNILDAWPVWVFLLVFAIAGYGAFGWMGVWLMPLTAIAFCAALIGACVGFSNLYHWLSERSFQWDEKRK